RTKYPDFTLLNVYFPNGKMSDDRLKFKLDYYDTFLQFIEVLRKQGEELIITGDFNTAHKEIDLANPKENEKYSGFLPIEREWMDKFESCGYIDTFRYFHPEGEQYTWWTYRFKARERNIGWRIDYFFVSPGLIDKIEDSIILKDVYGSDHAPILLRLK
ncbi:MAG: exodeoxyribonuclease III, partial [Candidatus Bathyarchaeota archaeon]|nr:exodeoxyribonuclease III [Candidatus Bathyarchaeota archaeon]